MQYMVVLLLFATTWFLYTPYLVAAQRNANPCTNARGQSGICVLINLCPSIWERLRRGSPADYNFLRSSQCGYKGRTPTVCCADHIRQSAQVTTTTYRPNSRPSVRNPSTPPRGSGSPERMTSLLPADCGSTFGPNIVGGTKTNLGEFPWLVALEYTNGKVRSVGCGGVLISPLYILTAAHCLVDAFHTRLVGVRLGEHDLSRDPDCVTSRRFNPVCAPSVVTVPIESTIRHPNYSRTNNHNDIGLLRLRTPATVNEYVNTICVPRSAEIRSYLGINHTVAGWGLNETGHMSEVKLKVVVPTVENNRCVELFRAINENINLIENQMCAGGVRNRDSCKGDSGGPLMLVENGRWTVIGIVSYGPNICGSESQPGIYTRVAPYIPWIHENIIP